MRTGHKTPRNTPVRTDYLCHGDEAENAFRESRELLHQVLRQAPTKLTRREILRAWPEGAPPPSEMTLWRWLDREVAEQQVGCAGTGERGDPFLYWLPGSEARWVKENPLYCMELLAHDHGDKAAAERFRRQAAELFRSGLSGMG